MAIVHQDFQRAIVVEVRGSHAMTIERSSDAWTSIEGDIFELPVVLVPVEHFALPESTAEAIRIYFWIDVTVGHK